MPRPLSAPDAIRVGAAWRLLAAQDATLAAALLREVREDHPAVEEVTRVVLRHAIARHRVRADRDGVAPALSDDGAWLAFSRGERPVALRLADGAEVTLEGVHAEPTVFAFDPAGRALAVGFDSGRLLALPLTPGSRRLADVRSVRAPMGPVLRVAWDGDLVWTGSFDHTLRAWDLDAGEERSHIELEEGLVEHIEPAARLALVRGLHGGPWRLHRLDGERAVGLPEATASASCWALRPDHRELALGARGGQVWVLRLDNPHLATIRQAGDDDVTHLAYSPDGHRLAVCDGGPTVYVISGSADVEPLTGYGQPQVAAWTPDGLGLVTGDAEGMVRVHHPHLAGRALRASRRPVRWVAAAADGEHVAWRGDDGVVGAMAVRAVAEPRRMSAGEQAVTAVAWGAAPDRLYAALGDGALIEATLDAALLRGRVIHQHAEPLLQLCALPDGRIAGLGPEGLLIAGADRAAYHALAPTLALGGPIGGALLVATTSGLLRVPLDGGAPARHPAGDPAWDDLDGDLSVPRRRVEAIAVDPDGVHVTLGVFAQEVERWRVEPPVLVATWTAPDVVWDVAASPDGRRIAVACGDSVVVRSADLAGAVDWSAELDDTVTSVAFSHDGVLVIAVCDDGTISWWHVEGGRLAGRIEGHASGTCVAPHPSEALLAVADERGVVGALRYAPGALLRLVRDATLVNPSDAERARYLFGLLPST